MPQRGTGEEEEEEGKKRAQTWSPAAVVQSSFSSAVRAISSPANPCRPSLFREVSFLSGRQLPRSCLAATSFSRPIIVLLVLVRTGRAPSREFSLRCAVVCGPASSYTREHVDAQRSLTGVCSCRRCPQQTLSRAMRSSVRMTQMFGRQNSGSPQLAMPGKVGQRRQVYACTARVCTDPFALAVAAWSSPMLISAPRHLLARSSVRREKRRWGTAPNSLPVRALRDLHGMRLLDFSRLRDLGGRPTEPVDLSGMGIIGMGS